MPTWTNTSEADVTGGTTFTPGPAIMPATGTELMVYQFLWCPTARPADTNTGVEGGAIDRMVRTNTSCFARGVKENIEFQSTGPTSWTWRRICFTYKGDTLNFGDNDAATSNVARQTSGGMQRLMTIDLATISRVADVVFRGTNGTDWYDHMIAPIDTNKIMPRYDRTRTLSSGNSAGFNKRLSLWHGMNKNIYYEDDENGDTMNTSMFSIEGRRGMGDYYIYDIFYPSVGGESGETLQVNINASYYWHER